MIVNTSPEVARSQPVVWEDVHCPLCDGGDEEVLLVKEAEAEPCAYRFVRCRACGLGYLNPRPSVATIGRYYQADYKPYGAPDEGTAGWPSRLRERLLGPRRDSFTRLPFHGERRLLDFGCGGGWYARRMQQRGWHVTGMDFSSHAAANVERRFGIPVHVGTLPHPAVTPGSFDAVTMGSVLEHVHDPHQVVAAAAEALTPGGLLAVLVPNLDGWGFRYFGEDWFGLDLPIHLLHFTQPTLRTLVEAHGLEVIRLDPVPRPSWVRRSFATARERPASSGRLLVRFSRPRWVASAVTRWRSWIGQADALRLIARRR